MKEEITNRLTIETAQNGFLVFLNDYNSPISVKPIPYVFETMENLQEFIKQKLSNEN